MSNGRYLRWVIAILACILLLSVIGGAAFDRPIALSYVETESMEPTIDAGDGFVAVPSELSGEIEEGDVVVFQATNVNEGEITTHRVVGETDQGYITQGDGNPFTDQDAGEPPITDGDIVATGLQVGGTVVVIPYLGVGVELMFGLLEQLTVFIATTFGIVLPAGPAGLGFVFMGLGVAVLLYTFIRGRDPTHRVRSWKRSRDGFFDPRWIVLAVVVIVVVPVAASVVVSSGTHEYGIVSADRDTSASHVIEAGETNTTAYDLDNQGFVPMIAFTEPASEGVSVDRQETYLEPGSSSEVGVEIEAPEETGYYNRNLAEYQYPVILPPSLIAALYNIHPVVAGLAVLTTATSIPVLLTYLVVGSDPIRLRSRSH